MKLLSILVKVEVDAAVVSSCLVDENVVEVIAKTLHTNNAKRRDFMVYDVLPRDLTLNHICSDDINNIVPYVKQLDEIVEFLLDEILNLLIESIRYVLREVEAYELASGGHRKEVGRNLVYAPVTLGELRNRPILPKPLCLVGDERNVVVVELIRDISKEGR